MNKTLQLLINRSSCRVFKDKAIPPGVTAALLEAGLRAPTGGNLQPYSIIKVQQTAARARLARLCEGQTLIAKAPLSLIFCVDFHRLKRWARLENAPFSADASVRPFWIAFQDTVICAQNICTAADALGLGSVYIGPVFDGMAAIRRMCRLPKGVIPVVSLALGYPALKPARRRKLGPAIAVHDEVYRAIPDAELLAAFGEKYKDVKREISAKDLKTIEKSCRGAHGAGFARRCLAAIAARGHINAAQIYFGLNYRADEMLASSPGRVKMLRAAGLTCFKS